MRTQDQYEPEAVGGKAVPALLALLGLLALASASLAALCLSALHEYFFGPPGEAAQALIPLSRIAALIGLPSAATSAVVVLVAGGVSLRAVTPRVERWSRWVAYLAMLGGGAWLVYFGVLAAHVLL